MKNINGMKSDMDSSSEIYQLILKRTSEYKVPETKTKEEVFNNIMAKLALNEDKESYSIAPRRKNISLYWISAVAATILLVVLVGNLFFNTNLEEVVANRGQQNECKLPDGSIVMLNAESKISFNKKKFDNKRSLSMNGEAFFSIKKGSTFTINTRLADIQILGTSFNVYARENDFKVACVTGKVKVTSGDQQVIIVPGEYVILEKGELLKRYTNNIENMAKWRIGEFYYEKVSLKMIFEELERQFNVKFVGPNVADKYFTGSFTNKNLVDALDIVCIPMDLKYEIGKNSQVFISTNRQ